MKLSAAIKEAGQRWPQAFNAYITSRDGRIYVCAITGAVLVEEPAILDLPTHKRRAAIIAAAKRLWPEVFTPRMSGGYVSDTIMQLNDDGHWPLVDIAEWVERLGL